MSEPSNRICPRCGKGGYIYYIDHSNMYEAKCYNCGFYLAFGELNLYLDMYEKKKLVTNADRIRAMLDEELAEWLAAYNERNAVCPNFGAHNCQASCIQCWLDWLKQEEKEQ